LTEALAPSRLILVGRILAPYGVKGWVKIDPYTESPESLMAFRNQWCIGRDEPGDSWKPVSITECTLHSGKVLAHFKGSEHREAALLYKGMGVAVPRSVLPAAPEGEFYQADLVGLTVLNEADEQLGRVSGLFSNGGHDVLRVRHEGGERLLPFVPTVVMSVDLGAGEIRVDWHSDW